MATFNGQKYLDDQISSIVNQDNNNWHVYIRDDGSTDKTRLIIGKYVKKFPDKFTDLSSISGGGNSKSNFFTILRWVTKNVDPDYYMLCDQDDYWLPDKISVCLDKFGKKEIPTLVHTDLRVVDRKLNIINDSFLKYMNSNSKYRSLERLLVQNNITGCTMMWNKELNKKVSYIDDKRILMHDWWIALIASAFGNIYFVDKATVLYRQHNGNVVGAKKVKSLKYILDKLRGKQEIINSLDNTISQANVFNNEYYGKLSKKYQKILQGFSNIKQRNKLYRVIFLIHNNLLKQSMAQIIGELMFI